MNAITKEIKLPGLGATELTELASRPKQSAQLDRSVITPSHRHILNLSKWLTDHQVEAELSLIAGRAATRSMESFEKCLPNWRFLLMPRKVHVASADMIYSPDWHQLGDWQGFLGALARAVKPGALVLLDLPEHTTDTPSINSETAAINRELSRLGVCIDRLDMRKMPNYRVQTLAFLRYPTRA